MENVRPPDSGDQTRSHLLSFIRLPPEALSTRVERVLAIVAVAFFAALIVDVFVRGL